LNDAQPAPLLTAVIMSVFVARVKVGRGRRDGRIGR